MTWGESNPLGSVQRYYLEERCLHGRSDEEIRAEFIANIDLLLKDLEDNYGLGIPPKVWKDRQEKDLNFPVKRNKELQQTRDPYPG